ncbi:hypothetical protein ABT381_31775 [Streptomyces sp. NPDC000151]|uniref:hypothetical protein n=1 Tax=Streptomyces sp. NPDC000151 TaxID=3154244 RepID=UPI00332C913E
MTLTPRPTRARVVEDYRNCTSSLNGITRGRGAASFEEEVSCLLTVQPGRTDVIEYRWDTGQASTVRFTNTTVARVGGTTTVTSTGQVSSGPGEGSTAIREVALPSLDLVACAGEGVSSQEGVTTLTFVL